MTNDSIVVFLTVAKQKNLTAAANLMHTTKQKVSQTIKALEAELDMPLIISDRRVVELTQEGIMLRDFFERAFTGFNSMNRVSERHAVPRVYRIAVNDWLDTGRQIEEMLYEISKRENCRFYLEKGGEGQSLAKMLVDGVDGVITTAFSARKFVDFCHVAPFAEIPLRMVISARHPAAHDVSMHEFRAAPLLASYAMESSPNEVRARELELCRRIGFTPSELTVVPNHHSLMANVDLRNGGAILPERDPEPDLIQVPTGQYVTAVFVSRQDTNNHLIERMGELLRETFSRTEEARKWSN